MQQKKPSPLPALRSYYGLRLHTVLIQTTTTAISGYASLLLFTSVSLNRKTKIKTTSQILTFTSLLLESALTWVAQKQDSKGEQQPNYITKSTSCRLNKETLRNRGCPPLPSSCYLLYLLLMLGRMSKSLLFQKNSSHLRQTIDLPPLGLSWCIPL